MRDLLQSGPRMQSPGARPSRPRALVRALRPHQWAKNLLLFLPLILAHSWFDAERLRRAVLAFGAMGACASAVYVCNDLLDLESDRAHPRKRLRPFASGALPIAWGPPLAAGLLAAALAIAVLLPPTFLACLGLYLAVAAAYSLWLKRKVMIDVVVLAGLYTLRILAGGQATATPVSEWLMAFAIFLFTSLAFAKRHAELARLLREGKELARGRDYLAVDLAMIGPMGTASGYLAVLVLAMYIHGSEVHRLYRYLWPLWLICPLLLYWISRLWLLAGRGDLNEDPLVFTLRDRVSWVVASLVFVLIAIAALPPSPIP